MHQLVLVARLNQDLTANHLLIVWAYWVLNTIFDYCYDKRSLLALCLLAHLECLFIVTLDSSSLASPSATVAWFQGVARQDTVVDDRQVFVVYDLSLQLLLSSLLLW